LKQLKLLNVKVIIGYQLIKQHVQHVQLM